MLKNLLRGRGVTLSQTTPQNQKLLLVCTLSDSFTRETNAFPSAQQECQWGFLPIEKEPVPSGHHHAIPFD